MSKLRFEFCIRGLADFISFKEMLMSKKTNVLKLYEYKLWNDGQTCVTGFGWSEEKTKRMGAGGFWRRSFLSTLSCGNFSANIKKPGDGLCFWKGNCVLENISDKRESVKHVIVPMDVRVWACPSGSEKKQRDLLQVRSEI